MVDRVPLIKDVMFVGKHFTLMTSVQVDESLRIEGESNDDFHVRLASEGLKQFYGWDVLAESIDVAIVE